MILLKIHFQSKQKTCLLGGNHKIVWFASAARPCPKTVKPGLSLLGDGRMNFPPPNSYPPDRLIPPPHNNFHVITQ